MTTLGYLRGVREWAYPTRKSSAFLEKGVLTPEEFVAAGDELVFKCPTWSWEAGDPEKSRPYLPKDKQYLVTRNVPCQTRVAAMENHLGLEAATDGDEDWMVSHILKETNLEDEFDILDDDGEIIKDSTAGATTTNAENNNNNEGADEYEDMDAFEDNNVLQDDENAVAASATSATTNLEEESNLVRVRTYDMSITYDKYYQTPRVWMVGKSAEGQPLSGKQMMEDVMSDYANRTVTIENHPHVAGPHASIHPCQHGKVMKTIVRNLIKSSSSVGEGEEEKDKGPSVEMYLFIFLKFVNSIIPTVNYDFTMDVQADTSK